MVTTTLDYIDDINVPGDVFDSPSNEYWALICLKAGMELIANTSNSYDVEARSSLNPKGNVKIFLAGQAVRASKVRLDLLTCMYHWYAISACQYVRTIGAIAHRQDCTKELPHSYVKRIIPEVLSFRDKVAAHFAWFSKHSNDNEAERLASILPPVTYCNDEFQVGQSLFTLTTKGKETSSSKLVPWNIGRIQDRLKERYWPNG